MPRQKIGLTSPPPQPRQPMQRVSPGMYRNAQGQVQRGNQQTPATPPPMPQQSRHQANQAQRVAQQYNNKFAGQQPQMQQDPRMGPMPQMSQQPWYGSMPNMAQQQFDPRFGQGYMNNVQNTMQSMPGMQQNGGSSFNESAQNPMGPNSYMNQMRKMTPYTGGGAY